MRLARSIGAILTLYLLASTPVPAEDRSFERSARAAVEKSVRLLLHSASVYTEERDCFSCHHQALPVMAAMLAADRGYRVDKRQAREQAEFTQKFFAARRERVAKGEAVPGGAFTAGYALVSLARVDWPADSTTDALVAFLLHKQEDDARWRIRNHRPPLEDSDFTATALSVRGLKLFAEKRHAEDIEARLARARGWLVETRPESTEDKAFHLLGLYWAGAEAPVIEGAVERLLAEQRDDGGWGQLADLASDAYATGQVLVALHRAGGLPVSRSTYQRGLRFLLETQRDDGSWLVPTRSRPIQTYFESGFPHGKSQFISISGTSWATMALAHAVPGVKRQKRF